MTEPVYRVVVVAGLIRGAAGTAEAERFLISQRPAGVHLAAAWELPGGKVEVGEAPEAALRRELREELAIDVEVGQVYAVGQHVYAEGAGAAAKDVILLIYEARLVGGAPEAREVAAFRWVEARELLAVPLPPADAPALARLRRELACS